MQLKNNMKSKTPIDKAERNKVIKAQKEEM